MADDPKIVPDPAPIEPRDVPVNADPPPAEPFDVPTYPDPAPGGTFDVKNFPDSPPIEPHDVPIYPDRPPAEPFDVPILPDLAPRDPFDVPLTPDGPPLVPFDVQTSPDGPPAEPFDVIISPDSPPASPFDVQTAPDLPPGDPFDVQVSLDGPPGDPFDVPIAFDPAPADPIDPATIPSDPGVPALPDPTLINVPIFPSPPPAVRDINDWIEIVAKGLNTVDRGLSTFVTHLLDSQRLTNEAIALIEDRVIVDVVSSAPSDRTIEFLSDLVKSGEQATKGVLPNVGSLFRVERNPENAFSNQRRFSEGQDFSIDEMVDAAVDGVPHPFMTQRRDEAGILLKTFDATKYFGERDSHGRQLVRPEAIARIGFENVQSREADLAASNFVGGVVRMKISPKEDPDGAVYSTTSNPSDVVRDDETRVPLCFTDLRKDPVRNAYRSVFFRPLNLTFSKSIQPDWQESSAFGRVDPIVSYKSTMRSYSVSFDLHAFAPEDLEVMYRKMTWLDSMCYPTYGSDSLMKSGPVTRMRIGDAVSTGAGGLSGIIKSLNFDFSEALWELRQGMKVPRSFKVSLEFTALHEGPVGLVNGSFGVFKLPPKTKQDSSPGQFTNFVGNGVANAGQPSQVPKGAEIQPGMYSKFGEPRRK